MIRALYENGDVRWFIVDDAIESRLWADPDVRVLTYDRVPPVVVGAGPENTTHPVLQARPTFPKGH